MDGVIAGAALERVGPAVAVEDIVAEAPTNPRRLPVPVKASSPPCQVRHRPGEIAAIDHMGGAAGADQHVVEAIAIDSSAALTSWPVPSYDAAPEIANPCSAPRAAEIDVAVSTFLAVDDRGLAGASAATSGPGRRNHDSSIAIAVDVAGRMATAATIAPPIPIPNTGIPARGQRGRDRYRRGRLPCRRSHRRRPGRRRDRRSRPDRRCHRR